MMRAQTMRHLTTAAALGWMGVIFALSSIPGSSVPGRYSGLAHFGVYAVLGALYALALPDTWAPAKRVAVAVLLASAYGVTDEFHQSFVPDRVPDVADWAVDTAGALLAAGALAGLQAIRARRRTGPMPTDAPEG